MNKTTARRKTSMDGREIVKVIGWVWVSLGVLASVSGVGAFLASSLHSEGPLPRFPIRFPIMDFFWQHYSEIALVQACSGLVIVFAGLMMLRKNLWAKFVIQFVSAVLGAWSILFGVYWVRIMSTFSPVETDGVQTFLRIFQVIMLAGGIGVTATFVFAFGLCMWALNRPAVKMQFQKKRLETIPPSR